MSVVVGLIDPGTHHGILVADTCITAGERQYEGHKIQKKKLGEEEYLVGAVGYLRNFEIAAATDLEYGTNNTNEIIRAWADKVLAACKDKGHGTNNDMETSFLIFFRGRLWLVGEDAYLRELQSDPLFPYPCYVIGSGADVALGYLLASKEEPIPAAESAVRTACRINLYCREPIETLETAT